MLAKRCAPELGSDRRSQHCVSPDTTPRFSRRRDSLCLWICSLSLAHGVQTGWSVWTARLGGRRQPHRAEDPGLTPNAQGGAAEALRTPAPCVRSTLPPCPATFLSLAQASRSGRRGISPRVRVDTNGGSACPRPLTLPATTGGCGGVWEREHMLLPRFPGPGQRFRPPRVAIGCASQQCRAQEEQPSSARKPHHPRYTAREAGAAPLPGHLPSDALTATTVAPAHHQPPRMNPHEMVRWRRGPRRREKRGVVFVLT